MATEFSDIYIDGITTEQLWAGGKQIREAWLDGKCIWRLINKIEYQKEICCWARHNGTCYGFGLAATKKKPLYNNWKRIYFKGNDIKNMKCSYVTVGNGVNDVFGNMTIISRNKISVYDFGVCVHSGKTAHTFLMNVRALQGYDIKSTLTENSVKVNELLGNEFINISDPLGTECNVFNNKYQIAGAPILVGNIYDGARARIVNTNDNSFTDIKFEPIRPQQGTPGWMWLYSEDDYYAISDSAYMSGKIFFSIRKGIAQEIFRKISYIPWLYMDSDNLAEIKRLKIDVSRYTHWDPYDGNGSYDYVITDVQGTCISSSESRVVFGIQLTVANYPLTGESTKKNVLCEYKNGFVSQSEIAAPHDSFFVDPSVKIIGEYIVICKKIAGIFYFLSGKSIFDMRIFNAGEGSRTYYNPRVFYEENGNLYYDAIYTPPDNYGENDLSDPRLHGTETSIVVKRKVNFQTGKVEIVSETEFDVVLEE